MGIRRRIGTLEDLVMLDPGAVLRGPDWNGEVYVKVGAVEFSAPGSENHYLARELEQRGPYTVLWEPDAEGLGGR